MYDRHQHHLGAFRSVALVTPLHQSILASFSRTKQPGTLGAGPVERPRPTAPKRIHKHTTHEKQHGYQNACQS